MRLMVVLGSVRESRVGEPVANWLLEQIANFPEWEVDYVDLKELALPFMDEPAPPRMRFYTKPHTIAWSQRVDAADAFIFVTPEYNHSLSPVLKNAIDFLFHEWSGKTVAFVSYGGVAGGARSTTALSPTLLAIGMARAATSLEIPLVMMRVPNGAFAANEMEMNMVGRMLGDLGASVRWRETPVPA